LAGGGLHKTGWHGRPLKGAPGTGYINQILQGGDPVQTGKNGESKVRGIQD